MELPFTIQIPVYNETELLLFSAYYFEKIGLKPHYVLDMQRTADAERIFDGLGLSKVFFSNDRPFIENGYESFAAASPTDWILRLDCDEVPSLRLIEACCEFVDRHPTAVAGFERHQVLWREGRFLTARNERFTPVNQRQWRLFNRKNVRFNPNIHTPGIHVDEPVAQASDAEMYHLSWVFLSWEDRLKKAARYDDHQQPAPNRANQLFPLDQVEWETLDAPFLQEVFAEWLSSPARPPRVAEHT